jgi:AcrR family transcriptional regulator
MAEIAQAANLSVGQIYRYFESKDAIVAAIVDQDLADSMVDAVIEQCSQAVKRNYEPDRAALALEVMAEAARSPHVAAIVRKADLAERKILRALLDEACPTDCSESQKAARGEVLSMIFDGMLIRAVNNPDIDRDAISEVLQAVLRLLLFRTPADVANTAA